MNGKARSPSALKSPCCLSHAEKRKAQGMFFLSIQGHLTKRSGSWVQGRVSSWLAWHARVSQHVTWALCDVTAAPPPALAASLAYCLLRTIRIKFHTRKTRTLEQGPVSAEIRKTAPSIWSPTPKPSHFMYLTEVFTSSIGKMTEVSSRMRDLRKHASRS